MVLLPTWAELMHRPESEIRLDQGALQIAAAGDPDVDVAGELANLDRLAERVTGNDCVSVCQLVFETLGMKGDLRSYDDPQNSYLHRVIERRVGIPISLSVLLMEIGRRRGVPLEGVGMPGHFLVRDPSHPELLIDAFAGGRRLDRTGCARLMSSVVGPGLDFDTTMLRPIGPIAILARMLANLDVSFRRRNDLDGRRWVTRMRAAIPGIPLADRVALADALSELGCYDEAVALVEQLATDPSTPAEVANALKIRARSMLSRFN